MKVAFISSEVSPFSKTGGLGDVSGTLPKELALLGNDVKVFTPKYKSANTSKLEIATEHSIGEFSVLLANESHTARIFESSLQKSIFEIYLIDCPHFFHRASIYTGDPDEGERFIFFSKAVIETIKRLNWVPDIIHCNDWQTGLIPALVKEGDRNIAQLKNTKFVFTIHNIAFQGNFKKDITKKTGLSEEFIRPMGPLEFYNQLSFLKAGISYSDIITTVSETYAKEILTKECGSGMEDVLRERKADLYGILNGVDYNVWNPESDPHIPFQYSLNDLSGKRKNKVRLQKQMRLPENESTPLIGFIARLTAQKGFDIITKAFNNLLKLNAQWIFLGTGEFEYEKLLQNLCKKHPDKVAAHLGFDNKLAHLIEAGADILEK